jgi:hypothetical protein
LRVFRGRFLFIVLFHFVRLISHVVRQPPQFPSRGISCF